MSAQPHDRASQADFVTRDAPTPQPATVTLELNVSNRARRRAAKQHARATLYALRNGDTIVPPRQHMHVARFAGRFQYLAQHSRRYATPVLLFALMLAALSRAPEANRQSTTVAVASSAVPATSEREAAQVAQRAPVAFAPPEVSSGGLVNQPAAEWRVSDVLGASDILPEPRLVKAVVPSLAADPPARAASAFSAVHVVASGETLGAIAERYHVSVTALAAANAVDPRLLPSGSRLRIPASQGVPHTVREGETVEAIAAHYGVPAGNMRSFAPNRLDTQRALSPGEELFVPGATPSGLPAENVLAGIAAHTVGVVRDDKTNIRSGPATSYQRLGYLGATTPVILLGQHKGWIKLLTVEGSEGWVSADLLLHGAELTAGLPAIDEIPPMPTPAPQPAGAPRPVDRWVWPASGDFTSGFGYRNMRVGAFHNGIDIANGRGTPIRAARAGRVVAAGWCGGYGFCVKINHGDGLVTEYGHLYAHPVVGVGEYVEAGQRIGGMGRTYGRGGFATGVHLHFTITLGGKAVNPLKYLP